MTASPGARSRQLPAAAYDPYDTPVTGAPTGPAGFGSAPPFAQQLPPFDAGRDTGSNTGPRYWPSRTSNRRHDARYVCAVARWRPRPQNEINRTRCAAGICYWPFADACGRDYVLPRLPDRGCRLDDQAVGRRLAERYRQRSHGSGRAQGKDGHREIGRRSRDVSRKAARHPGCKAVEPSCVRRIARTLARILRCAEGPARAAPDCN